MEKSKREKIIFISSFFNIKSIIFIQNIKIENMLDSLLVGNLICKIKNFEEFEFFLKKFVLTIDNWASCDNLKFKKRDKNKLINLSELFLKSNMCA